MTQIPETTVLVLQGGGALGAYQAGAVEALCERGHTPDWVAGISIGAINAAILAGNPAERRIERLRAFWEICTAGPALSVPPWTPHAAAFDASLSAFVCATAGVPGFYRPRLWSAGPTASVYDTAPLRATLMDLVDFDWLNDHGPRLSLGAVDVETGNFAYFDSREVRIGPDHVMASGALPPGFAAVRIDGRSYWDGGLVSNTPLQYVLESQGTDPLVVFQVDLFNARGPVPGDLAGAQQREKDIRYSSRTRLTTDRFRQLDDLAFAARALRDRLPPAFRDDPDLQRLCDAGPGRPVTLVHLIHRRMAFEGAGKDFEFSRRSMQSHWAAGRADVDATLAMPGWATRQPAPHGLAVYDLGEAPKTAPAHPAPAPVRARTPRRVAS